jgi:hypothetical protein
MEKISPWPLLLLLVLVSCTSLTQHRMKAANRKLVDAQSAQAAGDWNKARALLEGMRDSVAKSVADQPVRPAANGATVDLRALLVAWEGGAFTELRSALQARDEARSVRAFAALRQECAICHLALGRTEIKIAE